MYDSNYSCMRKLHNFLYQIWCNYPEFWYKLLWNRDAFYSGKETCTRKKARSASSLCKFIDCQSGGCYLFHKSFAAKTVLVSLYTNFWPSTTRFSVVLFFFPLVNFLFGHEQQTMLSIRKFFTHIMCTIISHCAYCLKNQQTNLHVICIQTKTFRQS